MKGSLPSRVAGLAVDRAARSAQRLGDALDRQLILLEQSPSELGRRGLVRRVVGIESPVLHQDLAQLLGILPAEHLAARLGAEGEILEERLVLRESAAHAVDEVVDRAVSRADHDDPVAALLLDGELRERADG